MWRSRPTARSRSPRMCTAPNSSRSSSSTDSPDTASTVAIRAGSVVRGRRGVRRHDLRSDGLGGEIVLGGTGGCRGCSGSIGWRGDGRDRGEQGERRGQRERVFRRDRQRGVRGEDPAGDRAGPRRRPRGRNERGVRRARRREVELQAVRVQPHRRNLDTGDTWGGGVAVAHVRGLGVGRARQRRARSRKVASAVAAACPVVHSKRPAAVPGTWIRCPAGRCRCWRRRLSANAVIRPAAASPDTVAPAAHGARSGASADAAPTVLELASRPTGVLVGAGG